MGFVKSYIQRFAYSSVTTDDWKNYLFTYFKDKVRKPEFWGGPGFVGFLVLVVPGSQVSNMRSFRWTS